MKSEKRGNIALIEQLQSTITLLRDKVKELKSDDEIILLKKTIGELRNKNDESELKAEGLEEKIEELETDQFKLVSDLDSCKSTDVDLLISRQETKECNEELEGERNKKFPCEFDKKCQIQTLTNHLKNQDRQIQPTRSSLKNVKIIWKMN